MRIPAYLLTCAIGFGVASAAALAAPPANNNCSGIPGSAQLAGAGLNEGTVTAPISLVEATKDGVTSSCGKMFSGVVGNSNDVWYLYTAGLTGYAEIFATNCEGTLAGTGTIPLLDLSATVFTGSACGNPTETACGYGLCHGTPLIFPVTSGQVYLLRIANYGNSVNGTPVDATATLNITELTATPPNDTCATAQALPPVPALEVPASITFREFNASANAPFPACGVGNSPTQQDVWFSYTAAQTGNARFVVTGPDSFTNTTITIFTDCGGSMVLDCHGPGDAVKAGCVGVTAGQAYKVRIARPASTDARKLTLTATEYQPGTEGESCATPLDILSGNETYNVNNLGFCDSPEDLAGLCTTGIGMISSVDNIWLRYTPSASGIAVFSTVPPNPDNFNGTDTVISAFSSCGVLIDCNDNRADRFNSGTSYLSFPVVQNVPVLVRIGTVVYGVQYRLSVSVIPPYANDECAGAETIVLPPANNIQVDFDNLNATTSAYTAFTCVENNSPGQNDLWYKWTAPGSGQAATGTCWYSAPVDSATDTILSIYDNSCAGTLVICTDNYVGFTEPSQCGDYQSYTTFNAVAGHTYYLRVAGQLQNFGPGKLYLRFTPAACPADFNHVNGVTVQDIFDFLTAWLAGC